jgi:hypothetical protein
LNKKGYLRKLLDNLTSHRSKIGECLSHNLRLTTQSTHIENKYAGLIVLNEVVNNLYQQKKGADTQTSEDRTNAKSASSKTRMLVEQNTNRTPVCNDLRADLHFFWLILHLLDSEGRMYPNVLDSISLFCVGRHEKIINRPEMWRVLDAILEKLKCGHHVEESAGTYLVLV